MTGTEPHAPRGTAGRGPDWDRGHLTEFLLSSFGSGKFGPRSARLHCDPKNGLAAGGAEMRMRRRVAPAARARPMIPSSAATSAHDRRCRFVQRRAAPA